MAGSETRIKTTTTTLRLSPEEREAVIAAAAAQGLGPSSFARKAALEAAGRPATSIRRRRDAIASALAPVLGELGRHGNLLNQLTRHAHVGGRVDPDQLAALRFEIERLTLAVLALREAAA